MHRLAAVEDAKALMNEAREWSVWRWLMEKRRVRTAADRANEVLAEAEKKVKAGWPDEWKKAYRALEQPGGNGRTRGLDPLIRTAIQRIKQADDAAESAHLDAEATFDEAERYLSTSLAREGTQKAIASWELREKAIRKAEALAREASPHSAGA